MSGRWCLILLINAFMFVLMASVGAAQSPPCQVLPEDEGLHPAYWYRDGAGGALIASGTTVDKEFDFSIAGDQADYEFVFYLAPENYIFPFTFEVWVNSSGWSKVSEYTKSDFLVYNAFVFDLPTSAISQIRFRLIPEGACLSGYSCIVEVDHFKAVRKDCGVGELTRTPTPPVTPSATSTSSTTPTVTPTFDELWRTPTPVTPVTPTPHWVPGGDIQTPAPATVILPGAGDFTVPTSIPVIAFAPPPSPFYLPPIDTPSPITWMVLPTPNYSNTITYSTAVSLSFEVITDTAAYTAVNGILQTGSAWISDMVSFTAWLSGEMAALQQTGTFTISIAPAWYAPDLPRPMADIGWTFEQLQSDINGGKRYTLNNWAWFAGYMVSLPFQLVKVLYQIVSLLGPLGLFMTWLLILLPYRLWIHLLIFIKNVFISLFNFVIQLIRTVLELIGLFF